MAFERLLFRSGPLALLLLLSASGTGLAASAPDNSHLAGGETTFTGKPGHSPFSQPAPNLTLETRMDFVLGEAIFEKIWVPSPSSTTASDGLGPLYNARSCSQCHVNDGRGHPKTGLGQNQLASLLRLSVPLSTPARKKTAGTAGLAGDPVYGTQLQPFSVADLNAEGRVAVNYTKHRVTLADGTVVELRKPVVRVIEPGYGSFDPELRTSFRIAPPMIGLGLLERIPAARIESLADPGDSDGDGISGRVNRVYDVDSQAMKIGRFGWKAGQPTLAQQNAAALMNDIGIGNPGFPSPNGNCTVHQHACIGHFNGNTEQQGGFEASDDMMRVLAFYTAHIAVPAARNRHDPEVQRGRMLFSSVGCDGCHAPVHRTADNTAFPELASQTIFPYTDLLLHDMGEGLADRHREFDAVGSEWRTAPLWGLGLTDSVSDNTFYLHDGRARTLLEAILWHGGEAERARHRVIQLSTADRNALIRFLESL